MEVKAAEVRKEKALKAVENPVAIQTINKVTTGDVTVEDDDEEGDPNEMTDNTPETRIKVKIY